MKITRDRRQSKRKLPVGLMDMAATPRRLVTAKSCALAKMRNSFIAR
ncbi:MAG: hypothetical protein HYX42_17345 [Polaromonas sp.]|nr:hypothetical protein [Polaromonas sp.]MBI2728008.1 hypothetical protein [Polaromonas sp.]